MDDRAHVGGLGVKEIHVLGNFFRVLIFLVKTLDDGNESVCVAECLKAFIVIAGFTGVAKQPVFDKIGFSELCHDYAASFSLFSPKR